MFAILQKYEFSSKSQLGATISYGTECCLRYCKSTSFQANHNCRCFGVTPTFVVCDTAKVRVFKQITTTRPRYSKWNKLFAILQKYEFSSKSQRNSNVFEIVGRCLRYCKSTSFQANHNAILSTSSAILVVCDTAKVRVFKQITTLGRLHFDTQRLFAILQKYEFSSKSQPYLYYIVFW